MNEFLSFLPGFLSAYGILIIAASSPGPAVALLLGICLGQGRTPALITTAGIASGGIVLNLATLVGVGLILEQAAWAMTALRIIGATYLLWLAYAAFRKAVHPPNIQATSPPLQNFGQLFLTGFLLQITNPKAIVFWLAIAAIGATQGGGAGIVILFVIGAFIISFVCHGAWAILLSAAPFRAAYARARRWVEGILGMFFAYAAVQLAVSRA